MKQVEVYEKLIEKYLEKESLTISEILNNEKVDLELTNKIYEEWKKYHDEIFWHNAIYEISFMDEVPTPVRIQKEFDISYYFANKLFEYYMEVVNE